MWSRKKLTELNPIEFYQILKLRIDTFVVEQERLYHELDEKDLEAVHVYHANGKGEIDAYARVFEEGVHLVFGRVVTARSVRGQGLGDSLSERFYNYVLKNGQERKLK
ncbi:putative acyl-CoA N-acyltransferase [Streptococcus sanguinis]|uniref:Putative acyl-CoA N-acyltransferase n=1 Tax=Streptococcus sanguinis TaxID=1305 RepID=A0A0B7GNR4_STRSA|nr:putative acyl-CoA N-acyltransferase [Streptococcus sanguinis]